jgi:hypothetical protein
MPPGKRSCRIKGVPIDIAGVHHRLGRRKPQGHGLQKSAGQFQLLKPRLSREWKRIFLNMGIVVVTVTSPYPNNPSRHASSSSFSSVWICDSVTAWV